MEKRGSFGNGRSHTGAGTSPLGRSTGGGRGWLSRGSDSAYRELLSVLAGARHRLAFNTLAGGIVRLLCVAGAGLAVVLIMAALIPPSVPGALTLGLIWLCVFITALGAFVVLPLVRLPSHEGLAVRIDTALAPGANTLISSLQLGRRLEESDEGHAVSRDIMRMAVSVGTERARSMDMRPVTADRHLGKWLRQLGVVAVLAPAIGVVWPGQLKTSVWRLTHPLACGPAAIEIAVAPGDVELDAGADLTIEAMVSGTSERPALSLRMRGGIWKSVEMEPISSGQVRAQELLAMVPGDEAAEQSAQEPGPVSPDGAADSAEVTRPGAATVVEEATREHFRADRGPRISRKDMSFTAAAAGVGPNPASPAGEGPGGSAHFYSASLKDLQEDREYFVTVKDKASVTWNIRVNQPPRAVAFRTRYSYPDYTGLPASENVSASGDIAALKGSSVQLEVSANRELSGAALVFASGDSLEMAPTSPRSFAGTFRIMAEDSYYVTFTDPQGRERRDPGHFSVVALPDHNPLVRILSPQRSIDLPSDMMVDVSVYSADDYGLTSLALVYFMEGGDESRIQIREFDNAPREIYESYSWDLTKLGLLPGEVVYYSVEVLDNDTVSGPKASRSEVHSVRFPTMAEIYKDVQDDYEAGIDKLTETLRQGKELSEKLEEVSREIKSAENLTWEQRQNISGAVNEREKLGESVKQVTDSLEEIADKMAGSDLVDEEVFQKIMEIQKLLSQISNPEFLKSLEELSKALQNVDKEAVAKAMEELKANQEQLLKNLDRTIELLKRLKAEDQMQAALDQVKDLLGKQNDINSQLESDNPNEEGLKNLSGEESKVKAGLSQLEQSFKDLQSALESMDSQAAAQMGENAKTASEEGLQKDAQKATDQMQAGACQGALASGQKVSNGLSSMSKKMESSMAAIQQRMTQQMAQKLRKAAEDLVFVSKDQESVVSSAEASSPQDLARRQFEVHTGAAQVADELEEVIRSSFSISHRLGRDLGDALLKMEAATREFSDGKKQSGLATGWEAVPSLNKAAMELMKAGQAMASSSCPNPSGEQSAMQRMQSLCGKQSDVNMGTQGLVKRIQQDGGRIQPSTEEQLAQLAAQQEMVRKGMDEVAGELGDRKDVLGRLDDLVDEMQKVVDEMQRQHVDRQTVQRQQRILSRLLDAQRSVRRRDLGNERISRTGTDPTGRTSPDAIPPDLLQGVDRVRAEVLRGQADAIPTTYRRLVEEYFRAISSKGF
jgi:hypothetical protein